MAKIEVKVPDIGDFKDVPIIEILVKPGEAVKAEQSLITLESDKATMDVPSPAAGVVGEILVKIGDKVSMGRPLLTLRGGRGRRCRPPQPKRRRRRTRRGSGAARGQRRRSRRRRRPLQRRRRRSPRPRSPDFSGVNAGPAVRRLARELGLDLNDDQGHAARRAASPARTSRPRSAAVGRRRAGGAALPEIPDGRLRQIRAGRDRAALAHQAHFRAAAARLLGQRPPCHPYRRGRRHRPRGVPQVARRRGQGRQEGALSRLAAAAADEGVGRDAEGLSDFQFRFKSRQGCIDLSSLLAYRRRRRHARRARRRGRQGRRQEGRRRACARAGGALGQGARGQAFAGGHAGRDLHDLLARRHRRHGVHADRQCAGSGDPRRRALEDGAGLGRHGVPAAPDAAAVPLLRSSRHRRRGGGALHAPSRRRRSRTCGASCSRARGFAIVAE